jgi:hypothetical protein
MCFSCSLKYMNDKLLHSSNHDRPIWPKIIHWDKSLKVFAAPNFLNCTGTLNCIIECSSPRLCHHPCWYGNLNARIRRVLHVNVFPRALYPTVLPQWSLDPGHCCCITLFTSHKRITIITIYFLTWNWHIGRKLFGVAAYAFSQLLEKICWCVHFKITIWRPTIVL